MYSLTLALDGNEWSASRSGRFTYRERTHQLDRFNGTQNKFLWRPHQM